MKAVPQFFRVMAALPDRSWAWGAIGVGLGVGGLLWPGLSRPAIAQASFNQQLDIRPFNGTAEVRTLPLRSEADRIGVVAGQLDYLGDHDRAIQFWLQAATIYNALGDYEALGRTYDYIGLTYGQQGLYREAEDALRRRLAIARDQSDFQGQIYGWNNLGTVLMQKGSLQAARECFAEARAIATDTGDPDGLGASLSNLGWVEMAENNVAQAIEFYETAATLRNRGLDRRGAAHTLNNLGDAYRAARIYRLSAAAHRSALMTARAAGDRPLQLRALDGLMATYRADGQDRAIPALLAERVAVTSDRQDEYQALQSLIALGDFYRELGHLDRAYAAYQPAYELATNLEEPQTAAQLYTLLANLALVVAPTP